MQARPVRGESRLFARGGGNQALDSRTRSQRLDDNSEQSCVSNFDVKLHLARVLPAGEPGEGCGLRCIARCCARI